MSTDSYAASLIWAPPGAKVDSHTSRPCHHHERACPNDRPRTVYTPRASRGRTSVPSAGRVKRWLAELGVRMHLPAPSSQEQDPPTVARLMVPNFRHLVPQLVFVGVLPVVAYVVLRRTCPRTRSPSRLS
jgi:hypothetical protein